MLLLLIMTLAGSIPLVCYLIFSHILGDRFPVRFYMFILRVAIIFYLCPFQVLKYLLPEKLISLSHNFGVETYTRTLNTVNHVNMQKIDGNYLIYPNYVLFMYIVCLLAFTVCAFVTWFRYFRSHRELLLSSDIIDGEDIGKFIDEHPQFKKLRRKSFFVFEQEYADTPFAVGFRFTSIVLPKQKFSQKQKEYIYSHELSHILHHDVIWKALCTMAVLLHWYNPLIYILASQHSNFCEYYADEYCTGYMSKDEQKDYIGFIVRLTRINSYESEYNIPSFSNSLTGGKESMKKRIDFIFNKRKPNKVIRGFSILCLCLMILMSSMTVFAYESGIEDNVPLEENGKFIDTEIKYTTDTTDMSVYNTDLDLSKSCSYFVDEDGNITILTEENSDAEPYALCIHSYKAGSKQVHGLKSDGGCETKYYEAKICIKCGKCITGDYIKTVSYAKCPH